MIISHKKLILILSFFMIFYFSMAGRKNSFITFSTGLSTGYVNYGKQGIISETNNNLLSSTDPEIFPFKIAAGKEFLIGVLSQANLNFTDKFSLYADTDFIADFNSDGNNYSNHLDYSVSSGIKFYPFQNISGLSFSIGYLIGARTDFFKIDGYDSFQQNTPWGNGIKISIEYDFSRTLKILYLPNLGFSWRNIPRGDNYYDNIFQTYLSVNL